MYLAIGTVCAIYLNAQMPDADPEKVRLAVILSAEADGTTRAMHVGSWVFMTLVWPLFAVALFGKYVVYPITKWFQ